MRSSAPGHPSAWDPRVADLVKFVDFDYVARVARLNAATLAALAAAPAPPANVHLLTKDLENNSTLTWDASPGGLATGYEVLWRTTTSPVWEHVQHVGNVTRTTMNISVPQPMKKWVEAQVAAGGYGTVSEYLRQLLRAEQQRQRREQDPE